MSAGAWWASECPRLRIDVIGARDAGRLAAVGVLVLALAACGVLAPTPARHRPPLPDSMPMPNVSAEDLVASLEILGLRCRFDPGGDIPPSWNCRSGDQRDSDTFDVGLSSDEDGPIESVSASRTVAEDASGPADPAVLDRIGADAFDDVVALVVPEEHRPSFEELLAGVQSNYPMELGGGWYLGFDRNSISRTLRIVYAEATP